MSVLLALVAGCGDIIEIENRPPVIQEVTLAPESPGTDDTITADVVVTDPDGDAVELAYTWSVNEAALDVTGPALSGAYFSRGDTISVSVVASDMEHQSEPVSSSPITVANSGPQLAIDIEPAERVTEGAPLRCVITEPPVDPDGDEVELLVRWRVNGQPFEGAGTTELEGDTVPRQITLLDQVWECAVTASDSYDGTSTTVTASRAVTCSTGRRIELTASGTGREGTIQQLVIPADACDGVTIEAFGAQGGAGNNTRGARMRGTFALASGTVLKILVGQRGVDPVNGLIGGGGTFVTTAADEPLIIAGGGGACFSNCPADVETMGRIVTTGGTAGTAPRATNGAGGFAVNTTSGGGGGFSGNGANAGGGQSFLAGGTGGAGEGTLQGGFGGGGARTGVFGQGGGGGYSGGSCGDQATAWAGCGGGGSYNTGATQSNSAGVNEGNGRVIVTW